MKVWHFAAKDCSPPTVKLMQIDHFHTPAEELVCGALQGLSLFSILFTAHIKSCVKSFPLAQESLTSFMKRIDLFLSTTLFLVLHTHTLSPYKAVTD